MHRINAAAPERLAPRAPRFNGALLRGVGFSTVALCLVAFAGVGLGGAQARALFPLADVQHGITLTKGCTSPTEIGNPYSCTYTFRNVVDEAHDTLTTNGRAGTPQTGATFGAVNQYHLGLWFNDPQVPFDLGCEPSAMMPTVTPFNGEQHAGIQVLNTSNFGDNDGPLKHFPPSSPSGAFIDGIW